MDDIRATNASEVRVKCSYDVVRMMLCECYVDATRMLFICIKGCDSVSTASFVTNWSHHYWSHHYPLTDGPLAPCLPTVHFVGMSFSFWDGGLWDNDSGFALGPPDTTLNTGYHPIRPWTQDTIHTGGDQMWILTGLLFINLADWWITGKVRNRYRNVPAFRYATGSLFWIQFQWE
jgi:hypothetical protein